MNIIILGLPGAGKGTQAKVIVENQSIPHISTGDLLRKAYKAKTALGELANEYMSKGELVPDDVTIGIAQQRLNEPDCGKGFLLDGFPRNLEQAEALEKYLASGGKKVDHVLYIQVDSRILLERLTGRRVCSGCGETFHLSSHPPKVMDRCDLCSGILVQREDDREVTVKERLRVNSELTNNLVHYYSERGILKIINGSRDIAEVNKDILTILGG
ncbi:adenylate kinase [Paenibacillus ginsengarvi]|uniref:Adenylate kinase n=1 Tax=Paenibacillus ginsengarvi TaxID=400777 RepID=A0A3B0C7N2_9BACL|nr:adenylate kinase [Paenibacillus ginsengarvi]RKN80578.1 adenylate kinase [Paenibacillus ginsengarvi]